MEVSIIIPAYNAADTIADTLDSLLVQTRATWEAIIVDDGSSDETAVVVEQYVKKDSRFRLITQENGGVCRARNSGIAQAKHSWLLFLDADDWIEPTYVAVMLGLLEADPQLDAVHCGWAYITPDGTMHPDKCVPESGDLFPILAVNCFPCIHSLVLRRSLIEEVGGFDPSFIVCEDWDLWQRFTRTGAQFGVTCDVLAIYRMRAGSASDDGLQMLRDGLRVLKQAYKADNRVPNPAPTHQNGLPSDYDRLKQLNFACWNAALMIGAGQDAIPLFDLLGEIHEPNLEPHHVADSFFQAPLIPGCHKLSDWPDLWPTLIAEIDNFLLALEARTHAVGLARRTRLVLEERILAHLQEMMPLTIGHTYAIQIEISQPFKAILVNAPVERIRCHVKMEGTPLGIISLPVCDRRVPKEVLTDAIAAKFAWDIIGRFFTHTLYPQLHVIYGEESATVSRGQTVIATNVTAPKDNFWQAAHNDIGWPLFLQELWDLPTWTNQDFYDSNRQHKERTHTREATKAGLTIELSQPLPHIKTAVSWLPVTITVGGATVGQVTLPVTQNRITATALRAMLTNAGGVELCRIVVREALLGHSFKNPTPLRARLQRRQKERQGNKRNHSTSTHSTTTVKPTQSEPQTPTLIISRHSDDQLDSTASRWATLPSDTADLVRQHFHTIDHSTTETPTQILYAPEIINQNAPTTPPSPSPKEVTSKADDVVPLTHTGSYGTHYFESLFASQDDPWEYTTPYEQTKYEQTLSILPQKRFKRALELACAEGHFTSQLAPSVDYLLATDISHTALDRAAQRCAKMPHIQFKRLNLLSDDLPEQFDLLVCSEVLYYVGDKASLQRVAQKFANALNPNGYLVMAHAHVVFDEPGKPGFDWDVPFGAKVIGEVMATEPRLHLLKEIRTPLYRIQLFQRRQQRWRLPWQQTKIELIPEQPVLPPPDSAALISWEGVSTAQANPILTRQLPILMYHRVSPTGSAALSEYRVTPAHFEEQLAFLQEAGFYGISLEEWRQAMIAKRPLPGRAIHLTFDDGYQDFAEYAFPLLQKYHFPATVFLVADQVGKTNAWDAAYGETVPLMDWPTIKTLQATGVTFGSHTDTHPMLTALTPTEIVREGLRSRFILEEKLGQPITTIAYPYGATDAVVQHLLGACGYTIGVTTIMGFSRIEEHPLNMPRVEVTGGDTQNAFATKLAV